MTKEEFLSALKTTLTKKRAFVLAREASTVDDLEHLIALTLHPVPELAFRASWVLELCLSIHPENMIQSLPIFLEVYQTQTNTSCQRHFTKIMMYFSKNRPELLEQYDLTQLIDKTFEWLIEPNTPVAVQVNCMDILFNLKQYSDWVEEELQAQINFLLKTGTPAMQSRGKRIINKLSKRKS